MQFGQQFEIRPRWGHPCSMHSLAGGGTYDKILQSYINYQCDKALWSSSRRLWWLCSWTINLGLHSPSSSSRWWKWGQKSGVHQRYDIAVKKRKTFCPIRRLNKASLVFWEREPLNLDVMCSMQN